MRRKADFHGFARMVLDGLLPGWLNFDNQCAPIPIELVNLYSILLVTNYLFYDYQYY